MANILIIDDDKLVCESITNAVVRAGHNASSVLSLQDGLERVRVESFDVVYLDVRLPDGNGLDILPSIRETPSNPEVIIITGYGDPDGAELAIRNGAWDYIEKPCFVPTIVALVRALQCEEEQSRTVHLNREIVGSSQALNTCLDPSPRRRERCQCAFRRNRNWEGFAYGIQKQSPG
jgi:two-component system NtrC family response regulator